MLAEWRDTIDVLLVFAGLFSAVLTTFVVQTSQNMQPDYNEASMFLLFEILKGTASNGTEISIPSSPTAFFSPSRSDEWLNSLWFVSLTLSLITALVAVLVKQWLHQYVAIVSDSSARDRARIRHMRFAGLQTWQVPMIIGLLPVLLHASLALFFAGLVIFMFSLGMKVAWLVSIIGAVTYIAYSIALILPLVHPYCPYKVPLTIYIHRMCQSVNNKLIPHIQYCILFMQYHSSTRVFGRNSRIYLSGYWEKHDVISQRLKCPTLKEIERSHIQKCGTDVDAQSLQWLHSSTSNVSVHQSVLQAFSGMTPSALEYLPDRYRSVFTAPLLEQMTHIAQLAPSPDVERELELYYRAYVLLCPDHWLGLATNVDGMADRYSNEQLKMVLYSMTSTEKATAVLLGILQGLRRSSLTLHPVVWKTLIDAAISRAPDRPGRCDQELELELMKIVASVLTTSESGDVTTIHNPTDEMRKHILDRLLACWGYRRTQIPEAFSSSVHLRAVFPLINRIQQRLIISVYGGSDRKQVIETSVAIIEWVDHLTACVLSREEVSTVADMLYSLLSSENFVAVGDLERLTHKILIIFDRHWQRISESITSSPTIHFYSVVYQCYLLSPATSDERLRNDTILPVLERLLSNCVNVHLYVPDSYPRGIAAFSKFYPLALLHLQNEQAPVNESHAFIPIASLVEIMLLLIKGHHESILYHWTQHPGMRDVWPACLPQLVQWVLEEPFRRWAFLDRVLAIVVIGELLDILDYHDGKKVLPQYDYEVHTDLNQPPWLHGVSSSPRLSRDGGPNAVEYSVIKARPEFLEFLDSVHPSDEDVATVYSFLPSSSRLK
ncbi:hypothetical protein IW261DRAFT_1506654 [Armillaria novae-zelandiae]|uniref:DUF6535 domain-containing protein n=1 Tax=Armillaria novae-zelandiae TaxID=153914 RepID=A0AA39NVQ5_9AGAR|nr:hypothetical protein IW261DRAFT_1506654 [Armillaria novae-zelandiae]